MGIPGSPVYLPWQAPAVFPQIQPASQSQCPLSQRGGGQSHPHQHPEALFSLWCHPAACSQSAHGESFITGGSCRPFSVSLTHTGCSTRSHWDAHTRFKITLYIYTLTKFYKEEESEKKHLHLQKLVTDIKLNTMFQGWILDCILITLLSCLRFCCRVPHLDLREPTEVVHFKRFLLLFLSPQTEAEPERETLSTRGWSESLLWVWDSNAERQTEAQRSAPGFREEQPGAHKEVSITLHLYFKVWVNGLEVIEYGQAK